MLQAKLMQVGQTEGYHLRGVNGSTEGAIAASPVPTWTSADATAVALGVAGDGLSCSAGAQKPGNVTITINAQSADGTPLTLQFNQPVGVPPANSLAVDFDNPTP